MSGNMRKYTADRDGNFREILTTPDGLLFPEKFEFSLQDIPIPNPADSGKFATYKFSSPLLAGTVFKRDRPNDIVIRLRMMNDSQRHGSNVNINASDDMTVVIDKTQASREGWGLIDVMCHEFGHILAYIGGLPANSILPTGAYNSEAEDVMAAEIEAWDVAQKVFDKTREECLAHYGHITEKHKAMEHAYRQPWMEFGTTRGSVRNEK